MQKNKKNPNFKLQASSFRLQDLGFTLLLAVLITSIILGMSVGLSIFIIRELIVSAIGRESQKAFFASDGGVECVLYWDLKQQAFASTTVTSNINCAGSSITLYPKDDYDAGRPTSFYLNFDNGACAIVNVNKLAYPSTIITSYGRNAGDASCNSNEPRRVERALQVVY